MIKSVWLLREQRSSLIFLVERGAIELDYTEKTSKYFYCYSQRLARFCQAFGLRYVSEGINGRTNTKYYMFQKSKKLDEIIKLWNTVKMLFDYLDEEKVGEINGEN